MKIRSAVCVCFAFGALFQLSSSQASAKRSSLTTTHTALSISPASPAFGSGVILTATVSPGNPGGTVTFYEGANVLGSSALTGSTATFETGLLQPGPRSLTARYTGNAIYATSVSAAQPVTIIDAGGGGFTVGTSAATDTSPVSIAYADFNGDHQTDIVTVNQGSNDVSVLLGNGNGTFAAAVNYPVGTSPSSVAVGDIDADGFPDLVVVNQNVNSISVLLGVGDGTFQLATNYTVGKAPRTVVIGDFNGDGYPDLAITSTDANEVSILLNTGTGTFGTAVNYTVSGTPKGITVGDFNADGITDLALVDFGNNSNFVSILIGVGDGTFKTPTTYSVANAPTAVATGDFNGDGKSDLAVANSASNNVSILLGNGDGTFQSEVSYATGTGPFTLIVTDFNGDLAADLAVVNNTGNSVSVLLGNGDGTFQNALNFATGGAPRGVVAANLNDDARVDLAIVNSTDNDVTVLLGLQASTVSLSVAPNPAAVGQTIVLTASVTPTGAAGNVTFYDGPNALATVAVSSGVASYSTSTLALGAHPISAVYGGTNGIAPSTSPTITENVDQTTTITFTSSSVNPTLGQPVTLSATVPQIGVTGNITFYDGTNLLGESPVGSGTATLVTSLLPTGAHTLYARYDGNSSSLSSTSSTILVTVSDVAGGGFKPPTGYAAGTGPDGAVTGDFNGDGIPDLAIANYTSDNVSILLGNGDGTFQAAIDYAVQNGPSYLAVADFNADGFQDLVVSNYTSSTLSVLLGNGDGTFGAASSLAASTLPWGVTVADFNGDGIPDIGTVDSGTNLLAIYIGNGDGTFQTATGLNVGGGLRGIASADLNNDGKVDVAITTGTGVHILLGNGNGTFASPVQYAAGTGEVAVAIADLGNGKPDLVVVNSLSNNVSVLLGKGDGTFGAASNFAVGTFPQSVVIGDFNGDGKPDLAVSNEADSTVSLLYGNGDGTFQAALTFPAGTNGSPIGLVSGSFHGTGQDDLAVANYQSNNVSVLVALNSTTVSLTATPNPDPNGTPVTLTAIVTPNSATGTVTFYAGSTLLGSSTITTGVATLVVTPPTGNQSLTAVYGGDSNFGPSTSPVIVDTIAQVPTTTTLTVSPSPAIFGQSTALTAAVNSVVAAGKVTFYSGSSVLGEAVLASGFATLNTIQLPAGVQNITARYDGQAGFANSTSAAVALNVVAQQSFSLSAPLNIAAGTPVSVTAADFNHDGKIDLAVANSGVSILLGNGDGTFQAAANYGAGTGPTQVIWGDFNGDGFADVAVSDATTNDVAVLLGKGDGTLNVAVPYLAGTGPSSLVMADFNSDGVPDLAVANRNSGNISLLLGNGDGTFAAAANTAVGTTNIFVAAGDFNADGVPDLAVADLSANVVWVLIGNGDGTFKTPQSNTVGTGPISITVGDFNSDGKVDLAVANQGSQNVTVLLGIGNGSFQAAVNYASGAGTQYVSLADFNGDGILDLIAANQGGTVSVLLGNGDGTFKSPVSYLTAANPLSLVVGNFNGDRKAQVAVANQGGGNVSVLLDGPPVLTSIVGSPQTTPAGSQYPSLLQVHVIGFGVPATGASVLFSAPASGASVFFANSGATTTVTSGSDGNALSPVVTANGLAGPFTVTASVETASTTFSLTNAPTPCTYVVTPGPLAYDDMGGVAAFTVTPSTPSCTWGASSDSPWITLTNTIGTGSGSGTVTVAANTTGVERLGNLLIAGQIVSVNEWGTQQVFADVPPTAYYFDAVNTLYAKGITDGCSVTPLNFCPTGTLTRADMAIFVVRSIYGGDNFTASSIPYFADVPVGSFGFQWIQKLSELGITASCGNNDYCPNENVTRDDMAIFLVRARLGSQTPITYLPTPFFTDVPTNYFAFPWIQRIKQDQITGGCTLTAYCPTSDVLRGDLSILLVRSAYNLFQPVNYPVVSSISQPVIAPGQTVTETITGVNTAWSVSSVLDPIPGVTFGSVTVNSPTSITAVFTVSPNAVTTQPYSVVVVTGSEDDVLPNGLTF